MTNLYLYIYAALMIVGGVMGYKKAGSKASLYAGVLSGIFTLVATYMTQTNPALGYGLMTGISLILTFTFLKRLMATKKFMPSGMLLILTIIAGVLSALQLANF
jgi:uncharacterized membrane protein (UPF0136 family)